MDNHANQFAPSTPIDPPRSGIPADKCQECHPEAIALSAYYRAEARRFTSGGEMNDWLEAEREIAAAQGADES